jgi:hypothetical protein
MMLSGKHIRETERVVLAELNPARDLIFRITHRDNIPWILKHGLHCRNSEVLDPNFVSIGNTDIIERRQHRVVPCPPGGTLSDYIPFYFTPRSIMLMNILTGYNGIRKRSQAEIVIIVSSLLKLQAGKQKFLFTDRHASMTGARFSGDLENLNWIDWPILQNSDFRRDNEDIGKTARYMAEALAYRSLPASSLLGLACCNTKEAESLEALVQARGLSLKVLTKRGWYVR